MDRVLFVATCNPFEFGGGSQATRAFLDATIDIFGGDNTDIVIPEEAQVPEKYQCYHFIPAPKRPLWKSLLMLPFGITGRFAVFVDKLLSNHEVPYSICIFNSGRESGYSFRRHRNTCLRKVTIHHNEEVEYCMTTRHFTTLYGLWPYLVKRIQGWAYKYSDINLFLTIQDKDRFCQLYKDSKGRSEVIGTFDARDYPIVSAVKTEKDFMLVASGSLVDYQTVHGVLDFYNRYLQIAKNLIPDLRVLLTGRNPREEISQLGINQPNTFTIVPNPSDILAQVQRGRIFLNPTDVGGGLKLRSMDGLKLGMPVLTHEVSARGYDFFHDKPYFKIYKDEESFHNGLKDIVLYLEHNPNSYVVINQDYYEYFGYNKGVTRMKNAFNIK